MKNLSIALLFTTLISTAFAGDYFVLSKESVKKNNKINKDLIKKIYLGRQLYWEEGKRIIPVHLKVTNNSTKTFIEQTLGMDTNQYLSYWRRKLFSGRGHPPKQFETNKQIQEFVLNNPNGIGIVSEKPSKSIENLIFFSI